MKTEDKKRYQKAFFISVIAHILGMILLVFLSLIFSVPSYEVIEVTLAEGDVKIAKTSEQEVQQEEKQEENKEEEQEKIEDEIPDPNLQPEIKEIKKEEPKKVEQKKSNVTSSNKNSEKEGDGGTEEYTVMPKIIRMVKPDYPPAARNMDKEGKVLVKLLISPHGVVEQAEVINSGGFAALDEAVLKAVYKWQFVPAKNKFKRPCACRVVVPVKFELK